MLTVKQVILGASASQLKERLLAGSSLQFIDLKDDPAKQEKTTTSDSIFVSALRSAVDDHLPCDQLGNIERLLKIAYKVLKETRQLVIASDITGKDILAYEYLCCKLQRIGASGLVVNADQLLTSNPNVLSQKIQASRELSPHGDFVILAKYTSQADYEPAVPKLLKLGFDGVLINQDNSHTSTTIDNPVIEKKPVQHRYLISSRS